MDLSKSYTAAVRKNLPEIDIVFDRFHVMALANRALDAVRRQQYKKLDKEGQAILKGQRFLLLKNFNDLSIENNIRINELFQINIPLFKAHALKEQLRLFWEVDSADQAVKFLVNWIEEARKTEMRPLLTLAKTLERHLY